MGRSHREADATPIRAGARSRDWLKLKLQHRAEFVVGGYTDPRRSREHFGALLLGYFDSRGRLCYAGNIGAGFDRDSSRDVAAKLGRTCAARHRRSPTYEDQPNACIGSRQASSSR